MFSASVIKKKKKTNVLKAAKSNYYEKLRRKKVIKVQRENIIKYKFIHIFCACAAPFEPLVWYCMYL